MSTMTSTPGPSKVAPSKIARYAGSQEWADVQFQTKYAPGVFWIDSAGHGGLVAVLDAATSLPNAAVQAARNTGRVAQVAVHIAGRRKRSFYSAHYTPESWQRFLNLNAGVIEVHDVWVAEEDCEKDLLLACCQDVWRAHSEKMIDPAAWRAEFPMHVIRDQLRGDDYRAEFLAELERLETAGV
jgi:hypothetical protein